MNTKLKQTHQQEIAKLQKQITELGKTHQQQQVPGADDKPLHAAEIVLGPRVEVRKLADSLLGSSSLGAGSDGALGAGAFCAALSSAVLAGWARGQRQSSIMPDDDGATRALRHTLGSIGIACPRMLPWQCGQRRKQKWGEHDGSAGGVGVVCGVPHDCLGCASLVA